MRLALLAPLFFLFSLTAVAEWSAELGPDVGAAVPSAVEAPDQSGTVRALSDLAGEKGAVLVFYRSASWCPFCKGQLVDLNARRAEIEATGYRLVGISYDPVEALAKFSQDKHIGFPLLSDEDSRLIKSFGLLNTDVPEKSRAYGIPYPMLVVVGADGRVQAKLSEESYRDRPEVDALLAAIAGLS